MYIISLYDNKPLLTTSIATTVTIAIRAIYSATIQEQKWFREITEIAISY